MSSIISFAALINHVTNENRFYEKHENSCDMSPKKDVSHFIYLNSKIFKGPCSPKRLCALVFLFLKQILFFKLQFFDWLPLLRSVAKNDCEGD